MAHLKAAYVCRCQVPRLQKHLGEETGLCEVCGMVYDEQLYWMRIRQHVSGVTAEDLDGFLEENDERYRSIPR